METLKSIGSFLLSIIFIIAIGLGIGLLVRFGAEASVVIAPYVSTVIGILFWFCILVLAPLSFFKKTRGVAGVSFFIASFVFGFGLWLSGFLITYSYWGVTGVIIGTLIFGVGVVFTALLALAINMEWAILGGILLGAVLTYGTRILGTYLAEKAENDKEYFANENINDEKCCSKCSYLNTESANFCRKCGNKLDEVLSIEE